MTSENLTFEKNVTSAAHINPSSFLSPTIKAWRFFLQDQGVSPHTEKAFLSDLNLFASYLPPDRSIGQISTVDINQFLDWMQNKRGVPCSPKTLARRITSIKAFFRWLNQFGVLMIDPAEKVPQKSAISPLPIVLTEAETETVLEAAEKLRRAEKPDARPLALAALLFEAGIKKSECLGLTMNHLELDAPGGPQIFVRYPGSQNRFKERKISLGKSWKTVFLEYAAQYDIRDRLFPWSQRRLEYILEDLGKAAGLEKHLSFDMCRWTCTLRDWRTGMEHEKIRQKLGVSKIQWREISMKLHKLAHDEQLD